jgi:plasmid stabilization system protein ParE
VSEPLEIVVSAQAAEQIRAAAEWWRRNRPKAPNAIGEDLDRASSLIAIQPELGARARNVALPGVRRLHITRIRYDPYYRVVELPKQLEILALWHSSRGASLRFEEWRWVISCVADASKNADACPLARYLSKAFFQRFRGSSNTTGSGSKTFGSYAPPDH